MSPAVITATWIGGDGNWSDSTKWSTGVVPNNFGTTQYQVMISDPAILAHVYVDGAFTVDSITNHEALTLYSGSQLNLVGAASFNDGLLAVQYAPNNTRLALGGTFTNDGTLRFEQTHWWGHLVGELYLNSDTLITGTGTIDMAAGSTPVINGVPGAHLTLGGSQTLLGCGNINVPVINHGTLLADNRGWLSLTAGATNDGVFGSRPGGYLSLDGITGTTTTRDIVAAGGIVRLLNTSLELNGKTLLADGGEVRLDGSTIAHGTVRVSDNSASAVTLYNAVTFTSAPWADGGAGYFQVPGVSASLLGDRHIPADANLIVSSASSLDLSGPTPFHNEGLIVLQFAPNNTRLTLGGTFTNDGTIRTEQTHWWGHLIGELYLNSDTLMDGSGTLDLNGSSTPVINGAPGTHLTFGADHTLLGGGVINVPVINHGTLLADNRGWLYLTAGVTNDGVLGSKAGGYLSLEGAAGTTTTQDIVAAGGIVRLLNTSLELNGKTLLADGGEVRLDTSSVLHGPVKVSDNSASAVTLYNTLTFTAAPWVDGGAGYFQVPGVSATLLGDRHIPADVNLIVSSGSSLDVSGATPFHNEGIIVLQFAPNNTRLTLGGTFTNDGTLRTEQTHWWGHLIGELYLNADTLMDGSGTLDLNGSSTPVINGAPGTRLTFGADHTLLGGGVINVPVINHGALLADNRGWLYLTAGVTNDGVLGSKTGGYLSLEGAAGTTTTQDIIAVGGVVRLLNTTLELNSKTLLADGGEVRMDGSTIAHGTVRVSDNSASVATLYNTLTFTAAPWADDGAGYFQVPGVSATLLGDRHIPADVNLIVSSGSSLDVSGATPFHNEGRIQLQFAPSSTRLTLGGTFTNDGTVFTEQAHWYGHLIGEIYLNSDTLVDGTGAIFLNGGSTPVINGAPGARLTIGADHTVFGGGFINVPVTNHGTLEANARGWLYVTAGVTNDGTLDARYDGYLSLEGAAGTTTTQDIVAGPSGVVRLLNTTLELNGKTLLADRGEVRMDNTTIAHGTVRVSDNSASAATLYNTLTFTAAPWADDGAGYFQVPGVSAALLGDRHIPSGVNLILSSGTSLDVSGATPFHNEGLIQLQYAPGSTRLALGGTFTNDGTIRTEQTHWYGHLIGELYLNADTLIDGAGTIDMNGGSTPVINGTPGAHLTLGASQTLLGGGNINVPVINHGTLLADNRGWLYVTASVTNDGTLGSKTGGYLSLEGAAGTTTTQDIVAGPSGVVRLLNTSLELNGKTLLADRGEVRLDGSSVLHGTVQVSDNSASAVTLYNTLTFTNAPWSDGGAGYFQVPQNVSTRLLGDERVPDGVGLLVESGAVLDVSAGPFFNDGRIELHYSPSEPILRLGETFTNNGTVTAFETYWWGGHQGIIDLTGNTLINGSGELLFSGGGSRITGVPGAVLTLGADQTLHGQGVVSVPVINHGTISADIPGGWLYLTGGVTNDATLGAKTGGILSLEGAAGTTTTQDIVANAATIRLLNTSLELNGKTLLASGGEVRLDGSAIAHGTVQVSDNAASAVTLYNTLTFTNAPWADDGAGYFQVPQNVNAKLLGDEHVPDGVGLLVESGAVLDVSAGPFVNDGRIELHYSPSEPILRLGETFTNNGTVTAFETYWWGGHQGIIDLIGNTLIDGTGELLFSGSGSRIYGVPGAVLTLGVDQTLHGQGVVTVAVVNEGTISADIPGGWLTFTGGITNNGPLGATGGGALSIESSGSSSTTHDIVAAGGTVQLRDINMELNGATLFADGGEMRIDHGHFAHGTMRVSDNAASRVTLANVITLDDVTLVDGGAGYFQVPGGVTTTLLGDRHLPAGLDLLVESGAVLDLSGAPFVNDARIELHYSPGEPYLRLGGTFTNNGTVTAFETYWWGGHMGIIDLTGSTLIDGTGELLFSGSGSRITGVPGAVLTLGANQTLRGQGVVTVPVVNEGTISADIPGGWLTLEEALHNHGEIGAWNGGVLHAKKGVTLGEAGHFNGDAIGYVLLSGDLLSDGTTGSGPETKAYVRIEGSADPLAPRLIEVVGRELGYTPAGFTENNVFAPLTLMGGYYQLVNLADDVAGEEAIYIDTLNVAAGATLDLNGQHIHVTHSVIEGTVIGDLGAPTSRASVAAPVWLGTDLPVSWVGVDDERGTGIACFDVYVSMDGGVATLWLDDTTDTSGIYPAQDGHNYGFYTVARDNLGYVETSPATADDATAEVRVLALTTAALDGATEDAPYDFTVHNNGEGLAGVNFTWMLTSAPGELAINPATGALSGTFDNTGVGDHAVTVRVDDSQGHHAEQTFTLNVANVAGTFTAQTVSPALLGAGYAFDLNSTDEGHGAVTYNIVSGPAWLTIDPATGTLSGTPGTHDLGQPGVTVSVDDGHGGTDTTSFTLDVQGQHLVLDPALRATKAVFTDANGDAVTATLTGKTGRVHLYRSIAPDGTGQYLNTTAGDLFAIELDGTDIKSGLTLTPKANTRLHLGDGFSTVGSVTGDGSLAKLSAAKFDVVGAGVLLPASTIAALTVRDLYHDADITLGGAQALKGVSITAHDMNAGTAVTLGSPLKLLKAAQFTDSTLTAPSGGSVAITGLLSAELNFAGPLGSLTAGRFGGGSLHASALGKLTVGGDASFDLTLTDTLAKTTLGTTKIGGDLLSSTWDVAGKIASITVARTIGDTVIRSGGDIGTLSMGASDGSVFGAGVELATLIANGHADTAPTGTIKTFNVKGWKIAKLDPIPRFMSDTQVSAKIGTMNLHNWDGLGGLWAPTGAIKKITHHDTAMKDAEHNWIYPEPARQVSGQPELFVHLL